MAYSATENAQALTTAVLPIANARATLSRKQNQTYGLETYKGILIKNIYKGETTPTSILPTPAPTASPTSTLQSPTTPTLSIQTATTISKSKKIEVTRAKQYVPPESKKSTTIEATKKNTNNQKNLVPAAIAEARMNMAHLAKAKAQAVTNGLWTDTTTKTISGPFHQAKPPTTATWKLSTSTETTATTQSSVKKYSYQPQQQRSQFQHLQ